MNIHEIQTRPILRVENPSLDQVNQLIQEANQPVIFAGLEDDLGYIRNWDLDFLGGIKSIVPIQQPEADGVNYFVKYFDMPLSAFVERLKNGENLYIGARKITTEGGEPTNEHGLGELAGHLKIPPWIPKEHISAANLWVGAGDNRTLLHYDPWNSFLLLGQGEKEFLVFPDSESHRMFPYSAFNFKALYQGKVLHSKIRPLNIQERYWKRFKDTSGFSGKVQQGEMIFIPAGYWHYVESHGLNIGINFFVHSQDKTIRQREPIRTYDIKDRFTLWPIRWYMTTKAKMFRLIRLIFPKKVKYDME